jgi:hypothetical protein
VSGEVVVIVIVVVDIIVSVVVQNNLEDNDVKSEHVETR